MNEFVWLSQFAQSVITFLADCSCHKTRKRRRIVQYLFSLQEKTKFNWNKKGFWLQTQRKLKISWELDHQKTPPASIVSMCFIVCQKANKKFLKMMLSQNVIVDETRGWNSSSFTWENIKLWWKIRPFIDLSNAQAWWDALNDKMKMKAEIQKRKSDKDAKKVFSLPAH